MEKQWQHCDFYWAAEAVEWVYESLRSGCTFFGGPA